MTCEHCCGAEEFFDLKNARKMAKKYRRKGAFGSTNKLIGYLGLEHQNYESLLDVGGGIGAVQLAFLQEGGLSVTSVDASSAYLKVSGELLAEQGWTTNVRQIHGDLVDHSNNLGPHDLVVLDKVICCYPDYKALLQTALENCSSRIALSFPLGGAVGWVVNRVASIYVRWFTSNPFRPYLHPGEDVDQFIRSQGFTREIQAVSFPWRQWVYKRQEV